MDPKAGTKTWRGAAQSLTACGCCGLGVCLCAVCEHVDASGTAEHSSVPSKSRRAGPQRTPEPSHQNHRLLLQVRTQPPLRPPFVPLCPPLLPRCVVALSPRRHTVLRRRLGCAQSQRLTPAPLRRGPPPCPLAPHSNLPWAATCADSLLTCLVCDTCVMRACMFVCVCVHVRVGDVDVFPSCCHSQGVCGEFFVVATRGATQCDGVLTHRSFPRLCCVCVHVQR